MLRSCVLPCKLRNHFQLYSVGTFSLRNLRCLCSKYLGIGIYGVLLTLFLRNTEVPSALANIGGNEPVVLKGIEWLYHSTSEMRACLPKEEEGITLILLPVPTISERC